jgi:cellulose synthase/poly-beta-1,6-N-acetylglucosamine synthase-like glycosyltransferase
MKLSAILTTYNRAALLPEVFRGLERQTLDRSEYEIVVIDDGSTDTTADLVARFSATLPIVYRSQPNSGLAAAKNSGIETAKGDIILFMDDDDVPSPELFQEHLRSHAEYPDEAVGVLGYTNLAPVLAQNPLMHFVTEVGCYLFSYPRIPPATQLLDFSFFWGGRSSCKARLLNRGERFNPAFRFGCEDIELAYRLKKFGLQIKFNRNAKSTMIREISFDAFCRRITQQGRSNFMFSQLHPTEEIRSWTDVADIEHRWLSLEPKFQDLLSSGRRLDALARHRQSAGIELEPWVQKLLHSAYWKAFDAARISGTMEMRKHPVKAS